MPSPVTQIVEAPILELEKRRVAGAIFMIGTGLCLVGRRDTYLRCDYCRVWVDNLSTMRHVEVHLRRQVTDREVELMLALDALGATESAIVEQVFGGEQVVVGANA